MLAGIRSHHSIVLCLCYLAHTQVERTGNLHAMPGRFGRDSVENPPMGASPSEFLNQKRDLLFGGAHQELARWDQYQLHPD